MLQPESHEELKREIAERIVEDKGILDDLRDEIRPLRSNVRRIQPRTTTSISLVGTDGGNNKLQFDPFLVQLIRVVDSSNNEYCLEAITPTTSITSLSRKQFNASGAPITAMGKMMSFLGISDLSDLSPFIPKDSADEFSNPTWVQVYRELIEWAILFTIIREKDFGTDTLIIFDGFLRTKRFARDLFNRLLKGLEEAIQYQKSKYRRNLYLAGIAKHSQVFTRYRLAMSLEDVLTNEYPCYLEVPRAIEEKAYKYSEYARGEDIAHSGGEINKFVGGKLFFVKFGSGRFDPIWSIDIFQSQVQEAQSILGYMLSDAINGFPVPFYPLCLQKAHENASLVDFDLDILQDQIYEAIRSAVASDAAAIDAFRFQDTDPAARRYQ